MNSQNYDPICTQETMGYAKLLKYSQVKSINKSEYQLLLPHTAIKIFDNLCHWCIANI